MTAPTVRTARGQVYLTLDEIPAVVAALLVEADPLEDAL